MILIKNSILKNNLLSKKIVGSTIRIIYFELQSNIKTPSYKSFSGLCTKIIFNSNNSKIILINNIKNLKIEKMINIFSTNILKIFILNNNKIIKNNKFFNKYVINNNNLKIYKSFNR
jgi:ribosomal protein L19